MNRPERSASTPGAGLPRFLAPFATRSAETTLRADLGLSPLNHPYSEHIGRTGVPEIQAYDPALFDGLATQWGRRRPLVGFFTLAAAQRAGVGDAEVRERPAWVDG